MDNSVFTKCGGANKVVNGLSIFGESRLAIIKHNTPVSINPEEVTHVALLRFTVATLLALPSEDRENMVSWFEISYALAYALHNSKPQKKKKKKKNKQTNNFSETLLGILNRILNTLQNLEVYIPSSFMTKYARKQWFLPLRNTKEHLSFKNSKTKTCNIKRFET
jgi:hypothetical protein